MEAEAVPSVVEDGYERIAVGSREGDAVEAVEDVLARSDPNAVVARSRGEGTLSRSKAQNAREGECEEDTHLVGESREE